MNANKSVTAVFTEIVLPQYTLTVNTTGNGSVALSPVGGTYDEGTVVTLTATADTGWEFIEWTGDLTGSENPINIIMDANKSVTAVFAFEEAIEEELLNASVMLYPNPTDSFVNIEISTSISIEKIELTDTNGRIIWVQFDASPISMDYLESAVYFVSITTDKGTINKRIIRK
jgi:hypothetical protein